VGRTRRSPPGEPVPVEAAVVVGQPGSRGTVVGTVRVVRDLADAPNLLPGEVLVTVSTSPSWVPWYRLAAAVVTDAGGALAHAAIVAREFGIPAVVGARDATRRLSTGMRVEVDGTHGRVRILEAGVDPD
jgi:phosphoenolpyruvate synthase/pyruvate phosphate dikinase